MVKIGNDWDELLKDEWDKPYYRNLRSFLLEEYKNETVYPPAEDIFTALKLTPYSKVKVVILGQDPYHEPGQAVGLAFSVPRGMKMPPSLVNILKELTSDAGASRSVAPGGTHNGDIGSAAVDTAYFRNPGKNIEKAKNLQDTGAEDAKILEEKAAKAEIFQDFGTGNIKNLENEAAKAESCQDFGTEDAKILEEKAAKAEIFQDFGTGNIKNLENEAAEAEFCQDFGTGNIKNLENEAAKTENCQDSGPGDEKSFEKGGVLAPWAEQGVLMLNTVLTVRAHQAGSHRGAGWEQFTDRVIELLAARKTPMVFVLWGAQAISKKDLIMRAQLQPLPATPESGTARHLISETPAGGEQGAYPYDNIDNQSNRHLLSEAPADGNQGAYPYGNTENQSRRHLIITAPHPSPLSAYRGFFGGRYFSRCNYFLEDNGLESIDWVLP